MRACKNPKIRRPLLLLAAAILAMGPSGCSGVAAGATGEMSPRCASDSDCRSIGRRASCRKGRCLCEPSCLTRDCGSNGCGGSCGTCGCGNTCRSGVCTAQIADIWVGEYECRQGRTGVTVELNGRRRDLRARFTFYAHPTNPGVPTGQYILRGSFDCDGTVRLEPDRWLERPPDYVMVGLRGTVGEDAQTLEGEVTADSCRRFRLQR